MNNTQNVPHTNTQIITNLNKSKNLHQGIKYFNNSSPNKLQTPPNIPDLPVPSNPRLPPTQAMFDLESVDTSLVSVISKLMGLPLLARYPLEWLPDEVRKMERKLYGKIWWMVQSDGKVLFLVGFKWIYIVSDWRWNWVELKSAHFRGLFGDGRGWPLRWTSNPSDSLRPLGVSLEKTSFGRF